MHTVSYKVLQIKHIIYTQQEHSLRLDTDTYIHIMTKPSSSTARVNSSPEEMPNSSSLVWFLSKLFPVGRALQRRCQINEHESSQYRLLFFFFFFLVVFLQLHFAVQLMLLSRKRSNVRSRDEGAEIPRMTRVQGASGEEVKGESSGVFDSTVHTYGPVLYVCNDGAWQINGGISKRFRFRRRRKDDGKDKVSDLILSLDRLKKTPCKSCECYLVDHVTCFAQSPKNDTVLICYLNMLFIFLPPILGDLRWSFR